MSNKNKRLSTGFGALQSLQTSQPTDESTGQSGETAEVATEQDQKDGLADTPASPEPVQPPTAPVPPPPPVAAAPVPVITPPSNPTEIRQMKSVIDQLTSYADSVNPKKAITEASGAQWQKHLHDVMISILDEPDPAVFRVKWTALLKFFHANKANLFNPSYAYRFINKWTGSNSEYENFRKLMWVAMTTSDVTSKQVKINMDKLDGLTSDQKNRLVSFYA